MAAETYIPIPSTNKGDKVYVQCKLVRAFHCIVILPVFGLFFVVLWSVVFNFEKSTKTHCRVFNFLPSVSAAIGFWPCNVVWRMCIGIHSGPRYFIIACHYIYNKSLMPDYQPLLAILAAILNTFENTALVTLTYVGSVDSFPIHSTSFGVFVITSILYMILTLMMRRSGQIETWEDAVSLKWQKRCVLANITTFVFALYFYWRHNKFCEPMIYSMFCLSEYVVVLSNIGFHYATITSLAAYVMCYTPGSIRP